MENGYLFTANDYCGAAALHLTPVPIDDSPVLPATEFLLTNYPNPFNPQTTIAYQLKSPGNVKLAIYNTKGQLVKELLHENQTAGPHSVFWDGRDNLGKKVSSGILFYKLNVGSYSQTKKMILLK
jgi:hypothetical protein